MALLLKSFVSACSVGSSVSCQRALQSLQAALGTRFASSISGEDTAAARPEADVTPDLFLKRVGGGCESLAEKFPGGLHEILESNGQKLKKMGVSVKQRKLIMRHTEQFKQGIWHPIPATLKSKRGRNPFVVPPAPTSTTETAEAQPVEQ